MRRWCSRAGILDVLESSFAAKAEVEDDEDREEDDDGVGYEDGYAGWPG